MQPARAIHEKLHFTAPLTPDYQSILTPEAAEFIADLVRHFDVRRLALLDKRRDRQRRINAGELPDFLPETKGIREADWKVAPIPPALQDRRVEITGPVE